MSSFEDIARYYESNKNDATKDVGLAYTCNCGWIDAGHAGTFIPKDERLGANNLWKRILEETDIYHQNGMAGYKVGFTEYAAAKGASFEKSQNYFIKGGLTTAQKEQVALAIFKEVSLGFEAAQGEGVKGFLSEKFGTGSSFSEEDLVSDLVGFYKVVKDYDWRTLCKPVSREAAEAVWKKFGAVGSHKNNTFSPNFYSCDDCSSSVFPAQYQSISDIGKGEIFFDFDGKLAIPAEKYELYFGSLRNTPQGLLFQAIPGSVTLLVKQNETLNDLGRRALTLAAQKAGIFLKSKQIEYATLFYPYPTSMRGDSKTNFTWNGQDLDKDGKHFGVREFNSVRGGLIIYKLNERELDELRKRKFNFLNF